MRLMTKKQELETRKEKKKKLPGKYILKNLK